MKFILEQIGKPILRKIGTFAAGYLAAQDVPPETIDIIINGFVAMGLVGFDLVHSSINRRKRNP